jgi:hypothetical protein
MQNIIFGTIENKGSYSVYTAPSILPKEMMERVFFSQETYTPPEKKESSNFDKKLKAVLLVPKPVK